ncbi:MAG: hypothetical protein ACT4NX_09910 [Deltaproteobacteria bacterium]
MEILISMKAEPLDKGLEPLWRAMAMPSAQTKRLFIAEFREGEADKLIILNKCVDILERRLDKDSFRLENTLFGFILKKKVDDTLEYKEAWERWVGFSMTLYEELAALLDEETVGE